MNEQVSLGCQASENVSSDTSDGFLEDLIRKVVRGFISSLQNDVPDMWQSFNEVLQIIQPYSTLIETNAQIVHYVERTHHHYCDNPGCHLDYNALALAFPNQISKLQDSSSSKVNQKVKFPQISFDSQSCEVRIPVKKIPKKKGVCVPKGTILAAPQEMFDTNITNMKSLFCNQEVNINDLRKSLPFVVYEIGLREASWGRPLGITATALNTDLVEMLPGVVSPRTSESYLLDEILPADRKSTKEHVGPPRGETSKHPLTGREVVEKFVKGHFLGSIKFAYLNRGESRHYDPYNLIVVSRKKIKPEHFVVSSHAILHIFPNRPSELLPLDEWYKEAILFNAILKFNFFKNFLISKMFLKWKRFQKLSQFRKLCEHVSKIMIACTPGFGSALLRMHSLVVDLDQVQLLPLNDYTCKPLQDFNDLTKKLFDDGQDCLRMFYNYCLSVINKTKDNCFEYLEYCKEQLNKKPHNPRSSMSLAKEKRLLKLQNMKNAQHEISQLEKFIRLVEQILLAKLLTLARRSICSFVNDVLDSRVIRNNGLFHVSLVFDKTDKLVLTPDTTMLKGSLRFALENVLKILCQTSEISDEVLEHGEENVERGESSAATSSETSDSNQHDLKSPDMSPLRQSPVVSVRNASLPRLSVYTNTPLNHGHTSPEKQDNGEANLKSLLQESLKQESLIQKTKEERSESEEPYIVPAAGFVVEGKTMTLQVRTMTRPLSREKLEDVILADEDILQAMRREEEIVNSALVEVAEFCEKHNWVEGVHEFVRKWNNSILASWRGRSIEKIENQLGQIKAWIEKMNKLMMSFCTSNGLLLVDCSGIRSSILPKLKAIFRQFTKMIAKDLLRMSNDFTDEVTGLSEQLSYRSEELKAFSEFMAFQTTTKEKVPALQVKVEYIKSLFEMIRSGQRQLTHEEEMAEEKTWSSWENFLLHLQESSDYLVIKTPQVLADIEDTIMSLEHQARVIGEKAAKGEYLIPENNPTMILSQLRELRQRFRSILSQLDELIKCRKVICGRDYNKSHLLVILKTIDLRYELWKYYDVCCHTITDWLQVPLRKMNIKKVTEKMGEWQIAADNLKHALPDDDQVFASWINEMESFMKDFPLIQQLSNDALKPRHWKALFVGMGQQYDPAWQFTIADLYSFKMGLYKELINSICDGAVREYALELQLRSLVKKWTEKDFKLAKHFARSSRRPGSETESVSGRNSSRKGVKSRQNQGKLVDMYILAGDDELKCLIEDNRVTLQLMLVSPHIVDLKQTVEEWMKNFEQLDEIIDLWVTCQRKWLYLSMVFDANVRAYEKTVLARFEDIDRRFKDFMHDVARDPKVLSVLAKKRGEKGYRELQGETLRSMLFSLLKEEEELLKSVSHRIFKIREAFPRLYFLGDNEVLDVLVASKDPRKLIPVIRKCFPGVQSVKFSFPDEGNKPNTTLDAALNAHLLQVTAIEGELGETVTLDKPIKTGVDSQIWLQALEKSMKTTLGIEFTRCYMNMWSRGHEETTIKEFIDKVRIEETDAPGETQDASTSSENSPDEKMSFLLRYPSQCIRCAEAVVWCQNVNNALSCSDKSDLRDLSMLNSRRVKNYAELLNAKNSSRLKTIRRLRSVLQSLLVYAIHQRDVVERLLGCDAVCLHSFEWQSCLQHEVSLKKEFSTTYYTGLSGENKTYPSQDKIPVNVKYEFEAYNLTMLGSKFPYGFEYFSERASLFISPLTERCFLSLSLALSQYSCGTLCGYNGSGKTEMIKELAKLMGRHIVFYNCSQSMLSSVVSRMLTGIVLSGSWVCFEDTHKLSQLMLSILGDYLTRVKQAYRCLMVNKESQYTLKGQMPPNRARSNSVTTLESLTLQRSLPKTCSDEAEAHTAKVFASIRRRSSITEGRNVDVRRYYGSREPDPISVSDKSRDPAWECETVGHEEEDTILFKEPKSNVSLGNIAFNGTLLRSHSMAGCFMTIIPDNDSYLNLPDNLKASLRIFSIVKPNIKKILEVLLLCNGFQNVGDLAEKVTFFIQVIQNELPSELHIGVNILKTAVVMAGNKLDCDHNDAVKNETLHENEEISDSPSQEEIRSITSAASLLEDYENRTREESAIVYGLYSVLCPKLDEKSKAIVYAKIDTIFTHTVLTSATQTNTERVAEAVWEHLCAESMQPNLDFISKVIQLYQVLRMNRTVIIMGLSGSGKTTIYKTLCKAINSLNTQVLENRLTNGEQLYPKVNLTVLFPRSMNESELFGEIDPVTNSWSDGILVKCARNAQALKNASETLSLRAKHEQGRDSISRSNYHQWIVLDGALDHRCVDQMNSLLQDGRSLSLASGEIVPVSETISFLLEVDELQNAAPSIVSHCGIVYCPDDTVGWKNIFKSWMKGAHALWNISIRGLGIIFSLMDHCIEATLTFLNVHCTRSLYANCSDHQLCLNSARGVVEVQRMLTILSSLFDKYILRENDETFDILDQMNKQKYSISCSSSETGSGRSSSIPAQDVTTIISSFAYSYIWAFGGDIHENCVEAFDEFSKALLSSGPHPHNNLPPVSVFDYHLDFPTGSLLSSTEKLSGKSRVIASSYVVLPRDEVYLSLLDILLAANKSVVLVGSPGSGKSSFMQNLVSSRYKYVRLSLAHGMSTQFLQETIESKVAKSKRRLSEVNNHDLSSQNVRNIFFLDDMNMAETDAGTSNQPSLELVRSLISLGGLCDRQRLCLKPLANTSIVGAAVTPGCPGTGGGVSSFAISPRLARIMIVLSFHGLSTATMQSIYYNLFQTWLEDFPAYSLTHHRQLAKHDQIVEPASSLELTSTKLVENIQALSGSTIDMFEKISKNLHPTPVNPHYVFTQHDIARIFQGMMLFSSKIKTRPVPKYKKKTSQREVKERKVKEEPRVDQSFSFNNLQRKDSQDPNILHVEKSWPVVTKKETLVSFNSKTPALTTPLIRVLLRLWCHECTRAFADRLIGEDELWFSSTLQNVALEHFCKTSLESQEEGTDVFQIAVTPKTPEATPVATLLACEADRQSTECIKDTTSFTSIANRDSVVEDKETTDTVSHDSQVDVVQSDEVKAECEIAMSDESSTDEPDMIPVQEELQSAPSKQRVVTFEDMSKHYSYRGPLITSDHLIEAGENLSKIIFCRHFTSTRCVDQERGYSEVSVAGLTQGLKHAQKLYNEQDVLPLDLVFFEKIVRHAARLSRALCLSSGNALLLLKSGHGRRSLVQLASFAANCKLIKLINGKRENSRQRMKSAVFTAGLQGKQVVLYVPQNIDRETMQDVCSLMSEGNCPGLYSHHELETICSELIPSILRHGRRNENVSMAQERFFRRTRTNLHVVVSLDFPQIHQLSFYQSPSLLTRACCIDVFQPWSSCTLTKFSILRLASQLVEPAVQEIIETSQSSVAAIMAYVHTSSVKMQRQQFGLNLYQCYSPKTFVEFVDMFTKCCSFIWKEEQSNIERCENALAKVREANEQIDEMQKDLDNLAPVLRNAEQDVKDRLKVVEDLQAEYGEGREKCKQQESEIEKMTDPIAELERLAKIELDRVSPVFKAAYDALKALNIYDVEEIRSYRTPPDQVVLVVNAVCLLFGKEETWEEGKVLFGREDFIADLEFFNMKAISDKTFRRLKEYVDNPKFVPEVVKEGSLAAMSICLWIRAVYRFCLVYREYFPKQQRVVEAKKIMEEAVRYLGELRVRCNQIKAEVEAKIEGYKEKVHHARSIEKQIQITRERKSRAVELISSMSRHLTSWKEKLRVCKYHVKTLLGDALLTAAYICYLGPIEQERREKLLSDWKTVCQGNVEEDDDDDTRSLPTQSHINSTSAPFPVVTQSVPCRRDFNLKGILSSNEELYSWRHSGLPHNLRAIDNALIMRAVCEKSSTHWPLLVDTDLQSYMWIRSLHQRMTNEGERLSNATETNEGGKDFVVNEDFSLLSPVSPCLISPSPSTHENDEELSINCEESDSTLGTSNLSSRDSSTGIVSGQGSRRTSGGVNSGLLIREDLAKELNIPISPIDDATIAESVSTDFESEEEEIVILSAADRHRDKKICRAVSNGSAVLLIDIERERLGTGLDNLLARNTLTEENGKRKMKIGSRCVDYHPAFQLYLYTNLPLELTAAEEEMSSLFTKCLIVNMSLSCEGLQEHLFTEVMALERPEYETQRRSLESHIFHHEQQIEMAENAVFELVISIKERLIENNEIPQALDHCDKVCSEARLLLEESKALYEISKDKQEDYSHVSEHGAAILLIVSRLSKLHSYYQTPLHVSISLIHDVVRQRQRGKSSTGSSLARSAELITYITRAVCSRLANSVFSDHYDVFTLLVAIEKLRLAGQIPKEEWTLFCKMKPREQSGDHSSDTPADNCIPEWIDSVIWEEVTHLDTLPGFQGLREAILSNSALWKEYFELPPILMAPTPSNFRNLSVFQRALLWKTFRKEKLRMICEDLVLYQLGTNATTVPSFSMENVYQTSNCTTPVVFVLTESTFKHDWRKQNLKDPIGEVIFLARRLKQDDNLRIVALGEEHQLSSASNILRTACQRGSWVIIKNCHLITEWPSEVIDILHQITLSGSKDHITSKHGLFERESGSYEVTSCVFEQSLVMHPKFRLWLVTVPDIGMPLPAVVIRYGIKLAWDDKLSYEASVRQSFLTLWNKHTRSNENFKELRSSDVQADSFSRYLAPLAKFHAILHQRCRYGFRGFNAPYLWSVQDLLWGYQTTCMLKSSVFRACIENQKSVLSQILSVLYGGQVLNLFDLETIVSLAEMHFFALPSDPIEVKDPVDVLFSSSPMVVDTNDIGLDGCVEKEHGIHLSKQLETNISVAFESVDNETFSLKPVPYFKELLSVFKDIKAGVHIDGETTATQPKESFLKTFFKKEMQSYAKKLNSIIYQLENVIVALQGAINCSPCIRELATVLSHGMVPRCWDKHLTTSVSLGKWIDTLKHQTNTIKQYVNDDSNTPLRLDISVFLNKSALNHAIMSDLSKISGIPLHKLEVSSELELEDSNTTATDVVPMTGFVLHNASWDERKGHLEDLRDSGNRRIPNILFKPRERCQDSSCMHKKKQGYFNCPVYFSDSTPIQYEQTSPVSYVPLPSTLPAHICRLRQVFLTSSLM